MLGSITKSNNSRYRLSGLNVDTTSGTLYIEDNQGSRFSCPLSSISSGGSSFSSLSVDTINENTTSQGITIANDTRVDAILSLAYSSGTDAISISLPSSGVTAYSLVLPATQGAASTVLTNDGAGNLSWAASSGGGSSTLVALTDTTFSTLTSGELIRYNGTAWVNTSVLHLPELTDVTLGTVSDLDILQWDSTSGNGAWVNNPFPEKDFLSVRIISNAYYTQNLYDETALLWLYAGENVNSRGSLALDGTAVGLGKSGISLTSGKSYLFTLIFAPRFQSAGDIQQGIIYLRKVGETHANRIPNVAGSLVYEPSSTATGVHRGHTTFIYTATETASVEFYFYCTVVGASGMQLINTTEGTSYLTVTEV